MTNSTILLTLDSKISDRAVSKRTLSVAFTIIIAMLVGSGLILMCKRWKLSELSYNPTKASSCTELAVVEDMMKCSPMDINCMCGRVQANYNSCIIEGPLEFQTALESANDCCSLNRNLCTSKVLDLISIMKSDREEEPDTRSVEPGEGRDRNQLNSTTLVVIAACIMFISSLVGVALYIARSRSLNA